MKLLRKENLDQSYERWDLEIEDTHCFFAEGVLVHNSSSNVSWSDGQLSFFSGCAKHESFVALFDQEKLRAGFTEMGCEKVKVFGEVIGGKIQGMAKTYSTNMSFIAFEVQIDEKWLDVPTANKVVSRLGLEFVPWEEISTDMVEIDAMRDKPSEIAIRRGCGNDKMREGVVLRPLIEVTKNNGERIIAKHKADAFRERATPQKVVDPSKLVVLNEANAIADEWVTPTRLNHVLQKMPQDIGIESTGEVIKNMVFDVYTEASGEIIESKEVAAAIGKKTAMLFKQYLKSKLTNSEG